MARKLLTVKFIKYSYARFFDDRVSVYYGDRTWWISGFGIVTGSDLLRQRPMVLPLDSGSEITYLSRTWEYGEFGKLAAEIEKSRLERALEAL